jgi:hypothetical protein
MIFSWLGRKLSPWFMLRSTHERLMAERPKDDYFVSGWMEILYIHPFYDGNGRRYYRSCADAFKHRPNLDVCQRELYCAGDTYFELEVTHVSITEVS